MRAQSFRCASSCPLLLPQEKTMCQRGHRHTHAHSHASVRNHVEPGHSSRRDFLRVLMGGTLAGASVLELAWHRAAWARSAGPTDSKLFDLEKAADGVYFAKARAQAVINCNAAVFVRSNDVVVVDAHSKPSAAASLLAQIKRELTDKPVRYVVNTHFHWDHSQGNHAYRQTGSKVEILATNATKRLMSGLSVKRMHESADDIAQALEAMRKRAASSNSAAEKAFCAEQIRQMEAYEAELKDFTLELPDITFDDAYELKDSAFDLHLQFHGRAHTEGDVFVHCPQRRAIATGDASHGWVPNLGDGFPQAWPATIDNVMQADFKYVLGGHGPMQPDRTIMTCQRNYIEELTGKVEEGKRDGLSVAEMQKRFTVASLRSLQSNGYAAFLTRIQSEGHPRFSSADDSPLQNDINGNIRDIYNNLNRA
ncbi:MBL fold metallo-hydrolase [Acidobacteria bacterium AB60]|nr:MBL fold metallo-hydrolase [Acidobacteria bacterium AB60]